MFWRIAQLALVSMTLTTGRAVAGPPLEEPIKPIPIASKQDPARTLEAAVDVMFRYQLGRTATTEDKKAIVAFLGTLNGQCQEPL